MHNPTQGMETPQNQTEIITPQELERLPHGVCLVSTDRYKSGTEVLGEFIVNLVDQERNPMRVPSSLRTAVEHGRNLPNKLIGPIMCDYQFGGYDRYIVEKILEEFPNLCWLRGTNYVEDRNGLPVPSESISFGANGYLGDLSALRYAEKGYAGRTHENPVLFITPLKALVEGVDSGAIQLGTEHEYDVLVARKSDLYDAWARKNWLVVDLGNGPEDFETARKILTSKALVFD